MSEYGAEPGNQLRQVPFPSSVARGLQPSLGFSGLNCVPEVLVGGGGRREEESFKSFRAWPSLGDSLVGKVGQVLSTSVP